MAVIALLSFYDEHPEWLHRYVEGLALTGVTRLIALDGRYERLDQAKVVSDHAAHHALWDACKRHGLILYLHIPDEPWVGDEVAKRSRLYQLADEHSTPGEDWYLVLDADEWITHAPPDLDALLDAEDRDALSIQITMRQHADGPSDDDQPAAYTRLLRVEHGLRIEGRHFRTLTPTGRVHRLVCSSVLPDLPIHVDHMSRHRHEARRVAAGRYYAARDQQAWETGER